MSGVSHIAIDFTTGGNFSAFSSHGWSAPEPHGVWSNGSEAFIRLTGLCRASSYRMEIVADPYLAGAAIPGQSVTILSGGWELFHDFRSGPGRLTFAVPGAVIAADGELSLDFRFPDAVSPREMGISQDGRKLGFALWRAELVELAVAPAVVAESVAASPPAPPQVMTAAPGPAKKRPSGKQGKVAAVTMVYNESEFLPIWLRH